MSDRTSNNEWSEWPTFGTRDPGESYVERPSAYVVLLDLDGQVAVVRTSEGVHLPGGGHLDGESPMQAALREVLEECGFAARLAETVGFASELVYAAGENCHFAKRCTFFLGHVLDARGTPELRHELLWCGPDVASRILSPASHRWAVDRAMYLFADVPPASVGEKTNVVDERELGSID